MVTESKIPQPGPARISKGGGPDEWLEAAKQCKYLPEAHMKQLCETVKEFLMEGNFKFHLLAESFTLHPGSISVARRFRQLTLST